MSVTRPATPRDLARCGGLHGTDAPVRGPARPAAARRALCLWRDNALGRSSCVRTAVRLRPANETPSRTSEGFPGAGPGAGLPGAGAGLPAAGSQLTPQDTRVVCDFGMAVPAHVQSSLREAPGGARRPGSDGCRWHCLFLCPKPGIPTRASRALRPFAGPAQLARQVLHRPSHSSVLLAPPHTVLLAIHVACPPPSLCTPVHPLRPTRVPGTE